MLFSIIILGLILRLISLNQSLWLDEAINVLATKKYTLWGIATDYAKGDFHPPLFSIILWLWTKVFGIGEAVVRLPSVFFGLLTIIMTYLIGEKLHSKTLGLISALLLAINPLHIFYSQEARMYSQATLAVSINIFLFIKLIKAEKVNIILLVVSNLFILMSDYVASLIFPTQFIFLIIYKRQIIKKWLISLFFALLLNLWWLPTFLNQLSIGTVVSEKLPAWKLIVGGIDVKTVMLTLIKFIIGRISYYDKLIYTIVLLPIALLFLFLIARGVKFISNFGRNLLIIWISVPIILAIVISFIVPIYSYFRLLFTLPSFIILVALGIISYRSKLRYIFLGGVLLVQIFSTSIYLFNPSYQREDWRGLVNYLKSIDKNSLVLFESSGTLPPFDYYAKNNLYAKGALKDFPAKNEEDVIDLNIYQNSTDIYLINYLVEISDPDRLVKKKLTQLGYSIMNTYDFNGVGFVYRYAK